MGNEQGSSEEGFNMSDYATDEKWHGYDAYNLIKAGNMASYIPGAAGLFAGAREEYVRLREWDRQSGIMKIEPQYKKQDFSYWSVAYIEEGLPYPQIQRVPVSDVKVTPHQISFDFFDTTEGKIGVSNATEKHMVVELDIYVTELVYYFWNHSGSSNQGQLFGADGTGGAGAYTGLRFQQQQYDSIVKMINYVEGKEKKDPFAEGLYRKNGEGLMNWITSSLNPWSYNVNDFQETQAFLDFRNTFLQQYSGWICKFTSQTFGVFDGVITDISYEIESGFSDAKWHVKIEEAIFTADYSEEGSKPSQTSGGSQNDSGDVQTDG